MDSKGDGCFMQYIFTGKVFVSVVSMSLTYV